MQDSRAASSNKEKDEGKTASGKGAISAPAINLPKGGGAIRGIGEKFAANPVTGTGSMTVPITTSPGRSGFGPQLSLSYDSGSGNNSFGIGWDLSLPSITRKTEKGLPRYDDANESDVFILSGAEDLVPVIPQPTIPSVNGFTIKHYRPRIEGLFARIERWDNLFDHEDVRWRSISKDNITTWYGKTPESRIPDPSDRTRIFSWLISESYDDKGNAILYEYKIENSERVNIADAHEANRADQNRTSNRYIKRIKYGNKTPRTDSEDLSLRTDWMFEVVFDYGEHYTQNAMGEPTAVYLDDKQRQWDIRQDPFSSYRPGFEVRTYRLCRRVLMFHHFPDELDGIEDYLVRSTEFTYGQSPTASFITSATQSGYKYDKDNKEYLKKSLPPLDFTYTEARIDDTIREIDPASLENLPIGLDGSLYQWVDLDGEGLSGILTEQAGGWFYKRNLSANNIVRDNGTEYTAPFFGSLEIVVSKPNSTLSAGAQFLDLAGNGQLDLVEFSGAVPGFYERTTDENWEQFRAFASLPNIQWNDPNMKFVDLTGDGHADILITEDNVFTWYPSIAEEGFRTAEKVSQALDEEKGPRLVFADGTQSIYLSDLSGDGLTDLVRIRNGEVCYWPNLGYGRFGPKVTMDNSPWFDNPDLFDQKRIRLADIDGSGTTDIIYLGSSCVAIYRNECGNRWSGPEYLKNFPRIDNLSSVMVVDLLGNNTACLVWSSHLPGDARSPMKYIDLMGGQKPHLLISSKNNLGSVTSVEYAPSTKFYLADKAAGKPWITKLPFPVHCVEKVTAIDNWRKTEFTTTYSYHHGYFDGTEQEFRGFGRVEQLDVETFDKFMAGNIASPYITDDHTLYQPPIKTVTWYHTGAFIDRQRILSHFSNEYFPKWFEDLRPNETNVLGKFKENALPEPDIETDRGTLSADEWREALRACKGMMLRQEVYELDVDALKINNEHRPVKLFSTAYHNCLIRLLQPKANNPHAVFHVTESEAITYNYELDLTQITINPDPRIAHTLNLKIDELGNILESVAAVYPRIGSNTDISLTPEHRALINHVQKDEHHLALNCTRFTEDIIDQDTYRLRMPCQTQTWEITGINPIGEYFTLAELKGKNLSSSGASEISYHINPDGTPQKRLVECARTLFFADDLKTHRSFGQHGPLALPYESYKLALTTDLLNSVYVDPARIATAVSALDKQFNSYPVSGYYKGDQLFADNPIKPETLENQYWIASGRAGFEDDAAQHFYLPERYIDPFSNETLLAFDDYDLYIKSSTDALDNTTRVAQFDFRVLAPREMIDINDNHTEVWFDALGMVIASAVKGKQNGDIWQGDDLIGFDDELANPPATDVQTFCTDSVMNLQQARDWLGHATARFVYHFGEERDYQGKVIKWEERPAGACSIQREIHFHAPGGADSPLQVALECSDGVGNVLMKKVQAEPETQGGPLRWIVNGLTVLNNKGKPVKQYEPAFSSNFGCEMPQANGVTTVMYYDSAGRLIRTEMPDGSFSCVEFSPWHVRTFDQNDTAYDPEGQNHSDWYKRRTDANHPLFDKFNSAENRRAAELVKVHANTPTQVHLDSLGREVISIAHNKWNVVDSNGKTILKDEKYLTFTKLDAEGKPLWICDARKNLVMQYIQPPMKDDYMHTSDSHFDEADPNLKYAPCYDIAGNLLFQHSMDAGDRWMLNDAAGKPMYGWDSRNNILRTIYDALHRPTRLELSNDAHTEWISVGVTRYGDEPGMAKAKDLNLRGKPYRTYDQSGLIKNVSFDFKGNPWEVHRRLASDYDRDTDWSPALTLSLDQEPEGLMDETFSRITEYDALNRMTRQYNWHKGEGSRVAVYEPCYNQRGILDQEDICVGATKIKVLDQNIIKDSYQGGSKTSVIQKITYNEKGQRVSITYGNNTITKYEYDPETFRLINLTTNSGIKVLQSLHYTYDPNGNITEVIDAAVPQQFFNNFMIEARNLYEYDALNRLIKADGREHAGQVVYNTYDNWNDCFFRKRYHQNDAAWRNHTQNYEYDAVGNILSIQHIAHGDTANSWTRQYQYATASNRLLATGMGTATVEHYTNTPTLEYRHNYNAHGSMTNMPHLSAMDWDFTEHLSHIARVAGTQGSVPDKCPDTSLETWYRYDAGKERTRKRVIKQGGFVEERLYLGGLEIYREYGPGGATEEPTLERETLHLMDDKQRIALVETKVIDNQSPIPTPQPLIRYQYSNHLGSAVLELNDQAQIISYEEYHPYGTTSYQAVNKDIKAAAKRYRYTGKERDEESGFSYHGARYYAPWLGRWIAADPLEIKDGLNVYVSFGNNPIHNVDLNGMENTDAGMPSPVAGYPSPENDEWVISPVAGYYKKPKDNDQQPSQPCNIVGGLEMIGAGGTAIMIAGVILSGPVGILGGITAGLLIGGGSVAIGGGAATIGLSMAGKEREAAGVLMATDLTFKLSSPGGLVGGMSGLLITKDLEGLEKGALFGQALEFAGFITYGVYRLNKFQLKDPTDVVAYKMTASGETMDDGMEIRYSNELWDFNKYAPQELLITKEHETGHAAVRQFLGKETTRKLWNGSDLWRAAEEITVESRALAKYGEYSRIPRDGFIRPFLEPAYQLSLKRVGMESLGVVSFLDIKLGLRLRSRFLGEE